MRDTRIHRVLKRAMDMTIAVPALLVLSPILAVVSLLIRWRLGTPVFFRQSRPGRNGEPFTALKFRTMTDACDPSGVPLPDDERLTPLGRLLRSASLDEIPGLINVIRGEMSLVGPRPLLLRYMPYFTEEERTRFEMPPGITGLAQISGRNDLDWDARLAADVRYVRTWTLGLDLKILLLTVFRVLTREGLRVVPSDTMEDLDVERENGYANSIRKTEVYDGTMAC
jgi:lipopolysaccharide/colanic/teichoic acid biosynthesis glycosyltransferase